jgi:signal transduction histidine kinase
VLDFFTHLLDPSGFVPRSQGRGWSDGLVWLHVGSDLFIALAYLGILLVLVYCARRGCGLPLRMMLVLLIIFLVSCSLSHFLEAYSFTVPVYRLTGLVKLLTAAASWGTVFAMIPVVPQALALRNPANFAREAQERHLAAKAIEQQAQGELEQLKALNRALEQRVAERAATAENRANDLARSNAVLEQQAQELRAVNRALVRSNQELDDFAYIASHDLKEPLRGIASYAQFIIEDHADKLDDDGRSKLNTIQHLSHRLSDLIDSLHQYARLGRVELAVAPADLNEVLAGVLDALGITLKEKNVEVRIPRPLPTVPCDRVYVGEVFHNLITNAIKYNDRPERWIEAGYLEPQGPGRPTVLYLRDNGIGIREKYLQVIFRIFKRLHGRDQYGGGTGAGLTIAKRIVERHGGRIWAESTHGEGSTFYFTLEQTD